MEVIWHWVSLLWFRWLARHVNYTHWRRAIPNVYLSFWWLKQYCIAATILFLIWRMLFYSMDYPHLFPGQYSIQRESPGHIIPATRKRRLQKHWRIYLQQNRGTYSMYSKTDEHAYRKASGRIYSRTVGHIYRRMNGRKSTKEQRNRLFTVSAKH